MDKDSRVQRKRSRNEDLERMRLEMRDTTASIMRLIQKRMTLSKQIGEIKSTLNMNVKDEKVEEDIMNMVLGLSDEIGMSREFSSHFLDALLAESVRLQQIQQDYKSGNVSRLLSREKSKQTHLSIFLKAKQIEASGRRILHMEVGEPDFSPPSEVRGALTESFDLKHYHYSEPAGILKLREVIAKKAGSGISEDMIAVTVGGRFAVFATIVSLLREGDEMISIEPAWPAYRECADFVGANTKALKTTMADEWIPDTKKLEEMINKRTKMIVLNYPNNPTGKILDKKILEKIVSIAKQNAIYLLSDEVYSDYSFRDFSSILHHAYKRSIMVSSFSKSHAMTGFRVGYAIADKEIISNITKVQATALTCVAEPMQYSALAALKARTSENVEMVRKRLDIISNRLQRMSLCFVKPDGAMYVYPQLNNGLQGLSLVEKLLDRGVAMAPGSGFGEAYVQFIRISACQPEDELEKGLDILESVLANG